MDKRTKDRLLTGLIYGVFCAALLLGVLAWGRYVSRGTSVDTNAVMQAGVAVGAVVFLGLGGIVRPRRR